MNVGERLGLLRPAKTEIVGEDGRLTITRTSIATGKRNTMTLPVTRAQMDELASSPRRMIQDIFPDLSADQREFLQSGMTPEEWARVFPPEEDDDA